MRRTKGVSISPRGVPKRIKGAQRITDDNNLNTNMKYIM